MLHITATIHFFYKLQMFYKKQEAREAGGERDPKKMVQARWRCYFWIFLDVVSARRHQSINPLIRRSQASSQEGARRCGRWGARCLERREAAIVLCKLNYHIGQ